MEPTRELAKQVGDDFTSISSKLRTCCVYGGTSYERQESELRKGVDILAGTPGRILDFIKSDRINLVEVDFFQRPVHLGLNVPQRNLLAMTLNLSI